MNKARLHDGGRAAVRLHLPIAETIRMRMLQNIHLGDELIQVRYFQVALEISVLNMPYHI